MAIKKCVRDCIILKVVWGPISPWCFTFREALVLNYLGKLALNSSLACSLKTLDKDIFQCIARSFQMLKYFVLAVSFQSLATDLNIGKPGSIEL